VAPEAADRRRKTVDELRERRKRQETELSKHRERRRAEDTAREEIQDERATTIQPKRRRTDR